MKGNNIVNQGLSDILSSIKSVRENISSALKTSLLAGKKTKKNSLKNLRADLARLLTKKNFILKAVKNI